MSRPARPQVGNIVASLLEVGAFARRVIAEAVSDGERDYWLRRAQQFEDAISRPDDSLGGRTPERQRRADDDLRHLAAMCRHRASLCEPDYDEVDDVLGTVD